jgi:hypothetical protein
MVKLPPHNQRRLNARIRQEYNGKYADWYELAQSMRMDGATYEQLRDRFASLGVRVSLFTIHSWLKSREPQSAVETVA